VRVTRPDGTEAVEQVPLTLEDVLHPEEGDSIVQPRAHGLDVAYLGEVFDVRLERDPTALALVDCQVNFNLPGVKPLCPDIAIFWGVVRRQVDWSSFNVAKEGARPGLVIEVTSPSTRTNDIGVKVDYYHRARVPVYVIADATKNDQNERQIELITYQRTARRYKRVPADPRGWTWLDAVGLWLGVTYDELAGCKRLACFDPVTGDEVGTYRAITKALAAKDQALVAKDQALAEAETRAQAEAQARAVAQARIRELEAAIKRSSRRKP
jgi:Uma2 family endonuclease